MCVTCSQLAKQVIASLWPYLRKHTQRHTSAYFETQEQNAHIYHSVVFPHFQRENTHTYLHTQLLYIRLSHPDDTLHKLSEAVKHTYAQMQSQGKEGKCRLYYVIRHTHTHKHQNTHRDTQDFPENGRVLQQQIQSRGRRGIGFIVTLTPTRTHKQF